MTSRRTRVALVTGASGGIGRATARHLSRIGFRVYGTSRSAPHESWPEEAEHVPMDVASTPSVETAIRRVLGDAECVDVLINNAGITLLGAFEETSDKEARSLFEVNVMGVHRVTRALLPFMRERRAGRIVTVGSVAGFLPKPFEAFYTASKHALEGLCESLDHEIRPFGIRSVLVQPGFVRTDLATNAARTGERLPAYTPTVDRLTDALVSDIARGCDPSLVAQAVERAATATHPRLRYRAGREASTLRFLRSFAPPRVFDGQLRKRFGLA